MKINKKKEVLKNNDKWNKDGEQYINSINKNFRYDLYSIVEIVDLEIYDIFKSSRNFFKIPLNLFDLAEKDNLNSLELLVFITLLSCGTNVINCYPSQSFLAKKTCMDKKTVRKSLNKLNEKKWIEIIKVKNLNGGKDSHYYRLIKLLDIK